MLQIKLDQPVSDPASPREISNGDTATNISTHIQTLRSEVTRLRNQLAISEQESKYNLESFLVWDWSVCGSILGGNYYLAESIFLQFNNVISGGGVMQVQLCAVTGMLMCFVFEYREF
jgi:hypothetical protein